MSDAEADAAALLINGVALLITICVIVFGFLLPTVVAVLRGHRRERGIFFLNIVVGWTGVGWILLLFYSVLSKARE